jgi:5-methylcytosine-specific restriction endonuclease McrA
MRTDILERKEEILSWISEELTLYEIKTRLGCKYETLRQYLKKMDIDYKGQQARKGQYKGKNRYKSIEDYIANARCIKSHILKQKLFYFGVRETRCELCGLTSWNNQPIPLELHHIDGNHFNNNLTNLQILCPNCHAQQSNNSGSAVGSYTRKIKNKTSKASEKALKKARALEQGASVDSIGRINERIISEDAWQARKELVLNSGIDLQRYGWKTRLQEVTGLTRRQVDDTIEHYIDEFKDKIYIRN